MSEQLHYEQQPGTRTRAYPFAQRTREEQKVASSTSDQPVAPRDLSVPGAERLVSLTAGLAADLDRGAWTSGALERLLAGRLLVGAAGDGQFTWERVRETLDEGSMVLHAGEGRLAGMWELSADPAPDDVEALTAVAPLLERVAGPGARLPDRAVR